MLHFPPILKKYNNITFFSKRCLNADTIYHEYDCLTAAWSFQKTKTPKIIFTTSQLRHLLTFVQRDSWFSTYSDVPQVTPYQARHDLICLL